MTDECTFTGVLCQDCDEVVAREWKASLGPDGASATPSQCACGSQRLLFFVSGNLWLQLPEDVERLREEA